MQIQKKKLGFTLIEILAVLSIIIVVMGLSVGLVAVVNLKTTEAKAHKGISAISSAVDKYRLELGQYPNEDRSGNPDDTGRAQWIDVRDQMGLPRVLNRRLPENQFNVAADPWGEPWVYMTDDPKDPVDPTSYTVGSRGRDRKPGVANVDDNLDDEVDNILELGYGDDITNKQR